MCVCVYVVTRCGLLVECCGCSLSAFCCVLVFGAVCCCWLLSRFFIGVVVSLLILILLVNCLLTFGIDVACLAVVACRHSLLIVIGCC